MIPLHIKVKPGSSKDEISRDTEGNLVVKIREKPIDGAANDYLIKFLSKEFGIAKSNIVLEKGQSSRFKKILINLSEQELETVLNRYKK
jgi:uncharacterized protein